ncbi:hypothetical protein J2X19_004182 [Rhodoferax ferrireducens]|uniref:DUF4189 domain-containing protein n=1 Tax=Rhodoferax ferrireducens TaxID=192843 RepID=A0ABU2CDT9_9BURK|nr:hypothetical protein [Rhodoferax ferrireducens]MDR7379488.1 hypothetical protein [Rhodoferax ferrireducens]
MPFHRFPQYCSLLAASLWAASALAADPAASAAAQAQYQREMAVCNNGSSNQNAATCRIEAERALAEARRGDLTAAPGQYDKNAVQRCDAFQGADRIACEARMRAPTSVEGSAQSGGVLRESVTIVPVPAVPATPASQP